MIHPKKDQGYNPDYADINGIKLKRVNEGLCCKLFSHEGALYLAKRQGMRLPTRDEWKLMLKPGHTWDYKERGIWIGANHALKQETIYSTFLPADGYMCDNREELYNQGSTGYYWSSTFLGVNAFYLNLDSDYVNPANICSRREGFSVRCVWVGK